MSQLRRHIRNHPALAIWLIAAALVMKVLVPAGFMPTMAAGTVTITVCDGVNTSRMTMALPGMAQHDRGDHDDDGKAHAEMPCPYAGLATPSLAAVDPVQLALAIAFVFAFALVAVPAPRFAPVRHLRPPLRGPPVRL